MTPPSERTKRAFRRLASPASLLVGVIFALCYTSAILSGHVYEARIGLALAFFSAGIMGVAYFEVSALRSKTIPYIAENSRAFYFLLLLYGLVFTIAAMGSQPVVDDVLLLTVQSFLIGMIAGTLWTMALILMVGLRYNVGEWHVIRFPVWIGTFLFFLYKKAKR